MTKKNQNIKIAGVIGDPIDHTRSPLIHEYWIKKNKINCFYIPLRVKVDELEKKLHYIKNLDFCGVNVTIPHKEKILKFADEITDSAKIIGAANTIHFNDGKIVADNSDTYGFYQSLIKNFPKFSFKKEKVLIIGSGGASRAVASVFLKEKVSEIRIVNRDYNKAKNLRDEFSSNIIVYEWSNITDSLQGVTTVINTTSLGTYGYEKFHISLKGVKEGGIAIDLVYNPLKTSFIKQAEKENLRTINGLDMLIFQAKIGFENWFLQKPSYTFELKKMLENSIKS